MTAGKRFISSNLTHKCVAISLSDKELAVAVYGVIKGKARARFNTRTGHAYTPQDTRDLEDLIKNTARTAWDYQPTIKECSVSLQIEQKRPVKPTSEFPKKPDLDNVAKLILDSLNQIFYVDDSQVTSLEIKKTWTTSITNTPRLLAVFKLDQPAKKIHSIQDSDSVI